jgi:hypothetical protein
MTCALIGWLTIATGFRDPQEWFTWTMIAVVALAGGLLLVMWWVTR